MIKCGIFVRCSIDNEKYPRDFAIGKIKAVDEFSESVEVEFSDVTGIGVYYQKPENKKYNLYDVNHCKIRKGAIVIYQNRQYIVKASVWNKEDRLFYYYVQSETDNIEYLAETVLELSLIHI